MTDYYLIAKISSTSGRNGFVNIISYSDFPERFLDLKEIFIEFFGNKKKFVVEEVKRKKESFTLKFKNFNSDTEAEFLVGKELFITGDNLIKLPEHTFFVHDLIGSIVLRSSIKLGVIKDVLQYPANDVYKIEDENGDELLIPAVLEFIEKFDPLNKVLYLKPGAGIYEDDEN